MSNYDYVVDQLTPEEREIRIKAAILELEKNPNASRRGVARNHGLPESTLRGRMKKLHINYKNYGRGEAYRAKTRNSTGSGSSKADVNGVGSDSLYPYKALSQQQMAQQQHLNLQLQFYNPHYLQQHSQQLSQSPLPVTITKSADFTLNLYQKYYFNAKYARQALRLRGSSKQHNQLPIIPEPVIPPFRVPPATQVNHIEFHSRVDRNYVAAEADEELETSREIKPTTINTLPKKLVGVKIAQVNSIKFNVGPGDVILTETLKDAEERETKLNAAIEEFSRNSQLGVREISRKHRIPESAIRRQISKRGQQLSEYCLSEELESRVLSILKTHGAISCGVDYLRGVLNDLITDFIKQDYYLQNSSLKEMLDSERIEEIGIEFLWKYGDEVVGSVRLLQLID